MVQGRKKSSLYAPTNCPTPGVRDNLAPITAYESVDHNHAFSENIVINSTIMESADDFDKKLQLIYARYKDRRPDLIIIFGVGNYVMAKDFNNHWKDIPMILCGEFDYMCSKEYVIDSIARPDVVRESLKSLRPQLNMTLVQTPIFYDETIQFIHTLLPDLKNITFIGGEDYLSREIQLAMEKEVKKNNLQFIPYISTEHSFDELLHMVSTIDKPTNAIVYKSWHNKSIFLGKKEGYIGSRTLLEDNSPLFYMHYLEKRGLQGGIGFVAEDYNDYSKQLDACIDEIIKDNKQPRNIPFKVVQKDSAVANIKGMMMHEMNTDLIPEDAKRTNVPIPFWKEHNMAVTGIAAGILILIVTFIFFIIIRHKNKKLRLYHLKELEMEASYHTLVHNIPILYTKSKLIFNSNGEVIDYLTIEGNQRVTDTNKKMNISLGGRTIREVYPKTAFTILQHINDARKCNLNSIHFHIEIVEHNIFYSVVIVFSKIDPEIIEIFALDTTELGKAKAQLENLNKQLIQEKEKRLSKPTF